MASKLEIFRTFSTSSSSDETSSETSELLALQRLRPAAPWTFPTFSVQPKGGSCLFTYAQYPLKVTPLHPDACLMHELISPRLAFIDEKEFARGTAERSVRVGHQAQSVA